MDGGYEEGLGKLGIMSKVAFGWQMRIIKSFPDS